MTGRHGVADIVADSGDAVLGEELRTSARVVDVHRTISKHRSRGRGHDAVTPYAELQSVVRVADGKGRPDRGAIPAELHGVGAGLGSSRPSYPLDRAAHDHCSATRTPLLDATQLLVG